LKPPLLSNWFVNSRGQLGRGLAKFVVPSRWEFALATPPVPANAKPLPEMEAEPMKGLAMPEKCSRQELAENC
jgi:hypothetical protein